VNACREKKQMESNAWRRQSGCDASFILTTKSHHSKRDRQLRTIPALQAIEVMSSNSFISEETGNGKHL